MRLKKTIIATMLAGACVVAVLSSVGCNSDSDNDSGNNTTQGSTQNGFNSNSGSGNDGVGSVDIFYDFTYYPLEDGTYGVSLEKTRYLSEVTVPSAHNGKAVTAIVAGDNYYGTYGVSYECLTKKINIPNSIKSIDAGAFYSYKSLESVIIPNGVTYIGDYAFYNCPSLESISIPDSVTSIGKDAFKYVPPEGGPAAKLVYNEYDNALYLGNSNNPYLVLVNAKDTFITSCNVNENTKIICNYAFCWCYSLISITIPNSVMSMGYGAFYCAGLADIIFNGTKAQWDAIEKIKDWNYNSGNYTVHCTDGDIVKEDS